jgi:hypothetical protein
MPIPKFISDTVKRSVISDFVAGYDLADLTEHYGLTIEEMQKIIDTFGNQPQEKEPDMAKKNNTKGALTAYTKLTCGETLYNQEQKEIDAILPSLEEGEVLLIMRPTSSSNFTLRLGEASYTN